MKFKGLTKEEERLLEFEVVFDRSRLRMTRLLRQVVSSEDEEGAVRIFRQNRIVNIARSLLGLEPYILMADGDGEYQLAESAWHNGELEMVMHRPNTVELVETIGDLIRDGALILEDINEILEEENLTFRFERKHLSENICVQILSIDDIADKGAQVEHPNIRKLVDRMDRALEVNDMGSVLHASASIFETLAKDVVKVKSVQNQTLASFFERYKKDSKLPVPVLDYILNIYNLRSTEPLAGHGSLLPSNITKEGAIFLLEMTKAFVRIERKLAVLVVQLENKK